MHYLYLLKSLKDETPLVFSILGVRGERAVGGAVGTLALVVVCAQRVVSADKLSVDSVIDNSDNSDKFSVDSSLKTLAPS